MTDGTGPGPSWNPGPHPGPGNEQSPFPAGPGEPAGGFAVPATPPLAGYPQPGSSGDYPQIRYPGYGVGPAPAGEYPSYQAGQYQAGPYPGYSAGQYLAGPYPGYPADPHTGYLPYSYGYPLDAYPWHPAAPDGYSPHGYPPGMLGGPQPIPFPRPRPGTLLAAAVLAFVTAGLDMLGCLAIGGAVVDDPAYTGSLQPWWATYLWIVILASLAASGLLIAGGLLALRGRSNLMLAGAIVTAVVAVFWISASGASGGDPDTADALRMFPPIYLAMMVVMVALALGPAARQWRPSGPGHRSPGPAPR